MGIKNLAAIAGTMVAQDAAARVPTLPTLLLGAHGTTLEGFEAAADWSAGSGTVSNDTVNKTYGMQGVKITTAVGTRCDADKVINLTGLDAANNMAICLYVENAARLSSFGILVSSVTNWTRYFSIGKLGTALHDGWNYLDLPPASWDNTGGEAWANSMIRMRLQTTPVAGQSAVVTYDDYRMNDHFTPAIMVTFDDAQSGLFNLAYPYMESLGILGSAYVATSWINTAGFLTDANLRTLQAHGWTVGNHTREHTHLGGLSSADQLTAINNGLTDLEGWGINGGQHVAYPFGENDANTRVAMTALSALTGRCASGNGTFAFMYADPYLIPCWSVANGMFPADITDLIDAAIAAEKTICILFHQIVAGVASAGEYNIDNFKTIMNYIISHQIAPITADDYVTLLTGPIYRKLPWT